MVDSYLARLPTSLELPCIVIDRPAIDYNEVNTP